MTQTAYETANSGDAAAFARTRLLTGKLVLPTTVRGLGISANAIGYTSWLRDLRYGLACLLRGRTRLAFAGSLALRHPCALSPP